MSTTIIAAIASILAILLPKFGVTMPTEQLTDVVQGLVIIFSSLWIWLQRTTLQKAPNKNGDVNLLGVRRD